MPDNNDVGQSIKSVDEIQVFGFGDPEPVMEASDIMSMFESYYNQKWYEPPISLDGLAKSFRANIHHSSAINLKVNILGSCYIPHKYLSLSAFKRFALDFLTFGNGYLEKVNSRLGNTLALKPSPAKFTRVGKNGRFFFVESWAKEHEFKTDQVFHLMEPDVNQEIYGVPQYLASLQSAWLNEAATLFRRKYHKNGSHAGYILYMSDAAAKTEDVDAMRQALKNSKGPGNFKNLFMYAPNGKKDGLQVIPISEVAAKDEFFNIKNVTRDDVLAGHRVPPQLMGVVPANAGGFGDIEKAATVFSRNELQPLMDTFRELNTWLGVEVVKFKPYQLAAPDKATA